MFSPKMQKIRLLKFCVMIEQMNGWVNTLRALSFLPFEVFWGPSTLLAFLKYVNCFACLCQILSFCQQKKKNKITFNYFNFKMYHTRFLKSRILKTTRQCLTIPVTKDRWLPDWFTTDTQWYLGLKHLWLWRETFWLGLETLTPMSPASQRLLKHI